LPAGSGLCRGAHAETNGIANASAEGVNLSGSTVYCTFSPCFDCAKVLVNLGVVEFVYAGDYPEKENSMAMQLFVRRGIVVRKFDEEGGEKDDRQMEIFA